MGTQTHTSTVLESLGILNRVIPLAAGGACGSLHLETERLILETSGRSLALGFWPDITAHRSGAHGEWLPTERWADEILAAWPRLEPGSLPVRDPFRALQSGQQQSRTILDAGQDLWPFSIYLQLIPAECRAAASRFSSRRWHILGLFASDERFVELATSNPGLAFALASAWRFRTPDAFREMPQVPAGLSGWKRRKIASWLGFPGTESAVRTLGIIDPQGLSLPLLLQLRERMNSGDLDDTLPRLDCINAAILRILVQPRLDTVASPNLLREIGIYSRGEHTTSVGTRHASMLEQLRGLARALGEKEPDTPIQSIRRLENMYRDSSERLRDRIWTKKSQLTLRDFGTPPFPGKPGFEPILMEAGLYVEGLEMRNCIPSCAMDVIRGRKYFYKVDYPVRATLMVERADKDAQGSWVAGDIRGPENKVLSPLLIEQFFRTLLSAGGVECKSSVPVEQPCYRQAELPW